MYRCYWKIFNITFVSRCVFVTLAHVCLLNMNMSICVCVCVSGILYDILIEYYRLGGSGSKKILPKKFQRSIFSLLVLVFVACSVGSYTVRIIKINGIDNIHIPYTYIIHLQSQRLVQAIPYMHYACDLFELALVWLCFHSHFILGAKAKICPCSYWTVAQSICSHIIQNHLYSQIKNSIWVAAVQKATSITGTMREKNSYCHVYDEDHSVHCT